MKRSLTFVLICCFMLSFAMAGCGQKKAASTNEAIQSSKSMESTKDKITYLVGQAKAFYNSKDFQGTVDIAQYILRYLDKDSQAAKDLLESAKEALTAQVKGAVEGARKDLKF